VTVGEFVAFQPAPGATLAPICRANRELSADELTKLEASIKLGTNEHSLLVDEFKKRVQCVKRASRRAILSEREARVKKTVDIDFSAKGEADVEKMKWLILNAQMKLLKFHENVRPEYWGTFCKTSTIISPRHPFKEDTELLEYDYDSDEDWEEEADAESLDGSDKEDEVIELDGEKHNADEYDFDVRSYFIICFWTQGRQVARWESECVLIFFLHKGIFGRRWISQ
jgi:chromatin assembly factor 1 subunit A